MMDDELSTNFRRLSDLVEYECKDAELVNLKSGFGSLQAANMELSVQNEELRAHVDSIKVASDGLHLQFEEDRQREAAAVEELETEFKLLVALFHEHIIDLEAQRDRLLAKLAEMVSGVLSGRTCMGLPALIYCVGSWQAEVEVPWGIRGKRI